jgi:hypothetical protein
MPSENPAVFLSHTSKNNPFVDDVRRRLLGRGFTVLEDNQFQPGDTLPDNIQGSILLRVRICEKEG